MIFLLFLFIYVQYSVHFNANVYLIIIMLNSEI